MRGRMRMYSTTGYICAADCWLSIKNFVSSCLFLVILSFKNLLIALKRSTIILSATYNLDSAIWCGHDYPSISYMT